MADYNYTTGPEGGTATAINIIAAGSFTLPSVTLAGGTLFVWANKAITLTIGGVPISLTAYGISDGFTLYYASGVTASGAVVITTAAANTAFSDFRCFAGAVSAEALEYYYNDVIDNSGEIVIP